MPGFEKQDLKSQRIEAVLYRCNCKHCDAAEEELKRLAKLYGALLEIRSIDQEAGFEDYAGWRTPVVYINGQQITHYQVNPKRWEEAFKEGRVAVPSAIMGEIVDIHCYMNAKAKGEEHKECAEQCLREGQPVGLVTRSGQLYLLVQDRAYKASFQRLRKMVSEEVRITGDIYERGGVQAIMVKEAESLSRPASLA